MDLSNRVRQQLQRQLRLRSPRPQQGERLQQLKLSLQRRDASAGWEKPRLTASIPKAGATLLELLVVAVVIAILAGLLLPAFSAMRARAQRVQCIANLRSLYVAAESYLQQNGTWPQIGDDNDEDSELSDEASAAAWIAALAPFGPSQKTWICPTIQQLMRNPDLSKPENVRLDYIATSFDDKPTTPHQWPRQPWFIETADVHGHGNLIIFTDGSISDLKSVIKKP